MGKLLNRNFDDINIMAMEDNSISIAITGDWDGLFQDESWSEYNSEESSSGNEDINDINSDIDTNNQRRIEGCC